MALDRLTETVFSNIPATSYSGYFTEGMGTVIDVVFNVQWYTKFMNDSVQIVVEESTDGITYSESIMTRAVTSNVNNEKFVFRKQRPYHRFKVIIKGSSAVATVVINQY